MFPSSELMIQSCPDLVLGREIAIVGNLSVSYPPDSLDGIQFGRAGRQEDESEPLLVLNEKLLQDSRLVIFGIVQNKADLTTGALQEIKEEIVKGLAIECSSLLGEENASFQAQRPEEVHLPGRGRENTRLLALGGPHSYQTGVSSEMHLVPAPELNIGVAHPLAELFLNSSCWRGSDSWAWRRGLCRVSPISWNSLWHWRTPRETAYFSLR